MMYVYLKYKRPMKIKIQIMINKINKFKIIYKQLKMKYIIN